MVTNVYCPVSSPLAVVSFCDLIAAVRRADNTTFSSVSVWMRLTSSSISVCGSSCSSILSSLLVAETLYNYCALEGCTYTLETIAHNWSGVLL